MLLEQTAKALPSTSLQVGDERCLKTRQDRSLLVGVSWRAPGAYSDGGQTLRAEKRNGDIPAVYHPATLCSSTGTVRVDVGLQCLRQWPGLTPCRCEEQDCQRGTKAHRVPKTQDYPARHQPLTLLLTLCKEIPISLGKAGYIVSLNPAWATWDPFSKIKEH